MAKVDRLMGIFQLPSKHATIFAAFLLIITCCYGFVVSSPRCVALCHRSEEGSLCKRCRFREPMRFGKRAEKSVFREPMRFGKRLEDDGITQQSYVDEGNDVTRIVPISLGPSTALERINRVVDAISSVTSQNPNLSPRAKNELRQEATSLMKKLQKILLNLSEDSDND